MSRAQRRIDPSLIDRLQTEPYRFEFFQAVRLLLAQFRADTAHRHDLDALGQVIRFRNSVSLGFPPSEIEKLEVEPAYAETAGQGGMRSVTITPSFMGLLGPSGVMPRHYTHYVAEREIYHRDTATRAFLDIFSSRAVALFYQAWLKYRLHLQYESDRKNRFLPLMLSLSGLGLTGTRNRLQDESGGVSDESLVFFSSALRERPQPVQWFARIAADYFDVPVTVEQFVGQWMKLPSSDRSLLGAANCGLGSTAICGERIWDRSAKVMLRIGPLRREKFLRFLPGRPAAKSLQRLFQLVVGPTLDCEVRLVLSSQDRSPVCLANGGQGAMLGWDGWLQTKSVQEDSCDVGYLINAAAAA